MANDVTVYSGIPFATVTRFRPPKPVPLAEMPPPGGEFGPPAAQNPDKLEHIWGGTLAPGSEDCLTLNVWTPAADGARRPVIVWIHGGAFVIGSGRWGWCDGTRLAERGVAVVTINYRLGAFGFLDLSEVGGTGFADSGNLGLLDQVAALRWVKENIARFGGDPDAVTVCGESAGGISVSCLLGCPAASGLFHRAIIMSGPPSMVRSPEYARRVTRRFLKAARVRTLTELEGLPTAAVLKAQHRTVSRPEVIGELPFGPTVDGVVLPKYPLDAVAAGDAKGVALLTGTTLDEARLWSLYFPPLRKLPVAALGRWLTNLGLDPKAVRVAYRANRPELGLGDLAMAVAGDALFWMPQLRLAEAQSPHRSDTRVYQVNWQTPAFGGRLGAPHAVEVPMVFGTYDAPNAPLYVGDGPDRVEFSEVVQRAWVAFARTGDPNHDGLPDWPAFDATRRPTMFLDRTSTIQDDPQPAIRRAWNALPFDGRMPSVTHLPQFIDVLRFFALRAGLFLAGLAAVALLVWLILGTTT